MCIRVAIDDNLPAKSKAGARVDNSSSVLNLALKGTR
jgi:hypothetical protein